jgi:sulfite reductase (NADPH) flavoprotein alpha-component
MSYPKTASEAIELISSKATSSASVFIYDLAEQVGFGLFTKSLASQSDRVASIVSLQTRAGAGLSLVGRLSQSTSQDGARGSVLTAYTTPIGLAGMVPSLIHLPSPVPDCRVILQVRGDFPVNTL